MNVCPECHHRGPGPHCPVDGVAMVPDPAPAACEETPDLIGRRFGERYEVEALLGKGGMGWVFKARHLVMGHPVALKVMASDLARNPVAVKRFYLEAQACSRLKHPNTIKVHDFGVSPDGYAYFVMELLEGSPLSLVLRRAGPLPLLRVVRIARQVCKSLAEAHGMGLVHRDLKPANIYLTDIPGEQDFVKVLDFGIVKILDPAAGDASLTGTGVSMGTPAYMSPEQLAGDPVDGRADLFSLGVVLYQLVSGRRPFVGKTFKEIRAQQLLGLAVPLAAAMPAGTGAPDPEFVALVHALLADSPSRRPASAVEVMQYLDLIERRLSAGDGAPLPAAASLPPFSAAGWGPRGGDDAHHWGQTPSGPGVPPEAAAPLATPALSADRFAAQPAAARVDPSRPLAPRMTRARLWSVAVLAFVAALALGFVYLLRGPDPSRSAAAPASPTGVAAAVAAGPPRPADVQPDAAAAPVSDAPANGPAEATPLTPSPAAEKAPKQTGRPVEPRAADALALPGAPTDAIGAGDTTPAALSTSDSVGSVVVTLDSHPQGAGVYQDGRRVGWTPLAVRGAPGSVVRYTFRGTNGAKESRDVHFGTDERVDVRLADPPRESASPRQPQPLLQPRHW